MTQEQARQEAERRVEEYWLINLSITKTQAKQCALISINREIELCIFFYNISVSYIMRMHIQDKLQDLNQIKDELLKM
jgi:hypothetical protein